MPKWISFSNKANLRDLIASISSVIQNEIQIDLSDCLTLKFDRWPGKTIGNLFQAPKSFVCHFIAIHEFKLELSSGNTQIGAKSSIFQPLWPSNLMDDAKFGSKSSIFQLVWPWSLMDDLEKQRGASSMPIQASNECSKFENILRDWALGNGRQDKTTYPI